MTSPAVDGSGERDFLLRSIADLDAEWQAGEIAEADYRRLRDTYVARAAAAMRRDGTDGTDDGEGPEARPVARRSNVGVVATVAALVVVAVVAAWLVARSSGERVADQAATGGLPAASTDRIALAQRQVADGDILDAIKTYDALLRDDPENPVALAERGWLVSRVDESLVDGGLQAIEQAIAIEPDYPDAHFYRGMILLQSKGDPAGAAASFQRALDAGPPPDLKRFIEQARDDAASAAAHAPTTSSPSG